MMSSLEASTRLTLGAWTRGDSPRFRAFPSLVELYGSSALLIRELVQQRNLVSYWLTILGIGFAIFVEGPVQQLFINLHLEPRLIPPTAADAGR